MHFEAHALPTKQFVAHKSKKMSRNDPCGYCVSHNSNLTGQAGVPQAYSSIWQI